MTSRRADAVSADRARAAEKAEADARVAADDRADELYVEGLALAADGELTREWLDARQDLLTPRPAAYRTLLAALEGDDVKDVPATVAELQAGLYGDPEQTRVLARAALFAGEITTGTYRAIDNKAAELMESGPASAFDRARQYLRNILIPHPDLSSPADKIRYARAIDEFDRLILEGELQNASDAEILPLRDEIEQRWVFISLSNTALALPNMRFADRPQSTDPNVVKATLLAASIELQRRVEANEIPPEAAVREAIVLEQWWTYLDQLLARAAQQSGAR